jgi:hypothetical protein
MATLRLREFGGELPLIDPYSLPPSSAQVAQNLKLWSGSLRPMNGVLSLIGSALASTPASIFNYDDVHWFEWAGDVDVRRSPVKNDSYKRVYYTGDGANPKVTYNGIATTGLGPYPTASYTMGVPAPTDTPTVTIGGTGSGTAETRYYVYTLVNSFGEEGPPSPISAAITVQPGNTVTVGMGSLPGGSYSFSYRRIYRTNTVGTSKAFQFVGQVTAATTSLVDSVLIANLGEVMQSTYWDPPPTDMVGLTSVAGQYFAGFRENELCLSEALFVHAWPASYKQSVDYKIVGLGELASGVAIMTEGYPYLALGLDPASLAITAIRDQAACVAKRGIVSTANMVIYPSPRGLVGLSSNGTGALLTAGVISEDDWMVLTPSTIIAYRWRDLYLAFYTSASSGPGGFYFDPRNPERGLVMLTGVTVTGGYVDLKQDALYVAANRQFSRWDAGSPVTYTWRSRPVELSTPAAMNVVQVIAANYPVTIAVFRDGSLQSRVLINSSAPRRISNGAIGRSYEVEVSGTNDVSDVTLASNMAELKAT